MAAGSLGKLLAQQVERSNASKAAVVQFVATVPGDGSQVSVDWWLHRMNESLAGLGISLEFADLDKPAQMTEQASPIQVAQLKRKIADMQAYIQDLEENILEKAVEMASEMQGNRGGGLSKNEQALRAVEQDGYFIDSNKQRWVDIATEAKRIGKSYISVWRAAKGIGIHKAEGWVVGETQAGGERILVKQGSFSTGKRKGRKKS